MPKSPLQTQFPLSENKKFWKKFYGSALFALIVTVAGILSYIGLKATGDAELAGVAFWISAPLIAFALIYTSCSFWYQWAYIKRYYFSADADFLTIKKGVFTPAEIHVQYRKIQDVYVDQDLMDRIFGLYDVHVASATQTSAMEAHIDGVEFEAAEGLKNYLLNAMRNGLQSPTNAPLASGAAGAVSSPAPRTIDAAAMTALQAINRTNYPLTKEWYLGEIISMLVGVVFAIPFWYFVVFMMTSKDGETSINDIISSQSQGKLLLVFLAFMAVWIVWKFIRLGLWVSHYKYAFERDYISQNTGVISLSEKHIPYTSVQNINVTQGLIDRLLGIADVTIENAATVVIAQGKNGPIEAADTINIEGLFATEARQLADLLRKALFSVPQQQNGL